MTTFLRTIVASFVLLLFVSEVRAVSLLSPNDFVIAIDTDMSNMSNSDYPGGEGPLNALDSNAGSKYLNFGKQNTGFIATPFTPGSTVQSIRLTTANDAEERDPSSFEIYGTNDAISSTDNSFGDQESWALIASGALSLPATRSTVGTPINFTNSTAYNSYRVVFPTLKNAAGADSMQIADFELFTGAGATGSQVFNIANPVVAIGLDAQPSASSPGDQGPSLLIDALGGTSSNYPAGEEPGKAIDGIASTKYLNLGGSNSGFIVTPSTFGSSQVQSFRLTTGNDFDGRDPASWAFYGTNDPIVSGDNSFGTTENWTLLDSGSVALPAGRSTPGPAVPVNNVSSFNSYKLLFPTLKDLNDPIMQIGEAEFYLSNNGSGSTILDPSDTILAIDEDPLLGTQTTHLNFGKENSGFIVTPSAGSTIIDEFQITTGGDEPPRDPASWELYGTNDAITSGAFSQGDEENWELIDSAIFDLINDIPEGRHTTGDIVSVNNTTAYSSYRMVFPTLRDSANANSLQMADVQFFGTVETIPGDFDGDGDVDGADFLGFQRSNPAGIPEWQANYPMGSLAASLAGNIVPEPTTAILALLSFVGGAIRIRRRVRKM